jgi:hypothetical protein
MSSFNFIRQKAGEYNITKNSQFVGKIKKINAQKWIVADVVDTPQHITKTLKDAKDACINLIIFNEIVDKVEESKYNTFVEVDKESVETSKVFSKPTLDPIVF